MELRLAVFVCILAAMMAAEAIWNKREQSVDRLVRWPGNFGVAMLGSVVVRILLPVTAAGAAVFAQNRGVGVFNVVAVPAPLAAVAAIILLDLTVYAQHRIFHRIPLLWRVHRMHHTDLEIDASTGLRFHPLELLLSMLIKLAAIVFLGVPPTAALAFEILLNGSSLFNHANVRLPLTLDKYLRAVVVTPDMHRVHHSALPAETDSNFGFFLSWWDKLFGTYTAQPELGHLRMQIGLNDYRDPGTQRLDRMLVNPFT